MIKYKGIAPPTFMELNGKNYLMPGFTEVPHSCGVHNWNDYIVWERIESKDFPSDKWTVESSSTAGIFYTVKKVGENYECDCPGYRFRRKECRHIRGIKESV